MNQKVIYKKKWNFKIRGTNKRIVILFYVTITLRKYNQLSKLENQEKEKRWEENLQKQTRVLYANIVVSKYNNLVILAVIIVIVVYIQNMQILIHGDREEICHGLLEPIKVELDSKKGYVIIYCCQKCGMIRKNKAAEDDNRELLIQLTAKV